jgi:HAD superfamily hydrolase (TIGR01509 family)
MPPRPRAAVFDLDGTLVDNMAFHGRAWVETARQLGVSATREQFEHTWAGRKADEIFELLLGSAPAPAVSAALAARKEEDYRRLYGPHLAPVPGLLAFLGRLHAAGVRLALATAAPAENRDLVLGGLGIASAFEVIQGPEGISRGKPSPDIFLAAADRLGLDGGECVAFEDAVNGVLSARGAGMAVAGVLTSATAEQLAFAGARWLLADYAHLPGELERTLFG